MLIAKYLEGVEPTTEELKAALRRAVIAYKLVPIYAGSSLRNKGVQPLLDAVVDYLPSPIDVPPVKGTDPKTEEPIERKRISDEHFSGLAFKIQIDPHVGKLTYVRIYSGTLTSDRIHTILRRGSLNVSGDFYLCMQISERKSKKRMQER